MFSKAKRFDANAKNTKKDSKKQELDPHKLKAKPLPTLPTPAASVKSNYDTKSQCSSVKSVKSFATPKPLKTTVKNAPSSLKKTLPSSYSAYKKTNPVNSISDKKLAEDIIKSQEAEIRNKDKTILEYNEQIEDLKNEIAKLQTKVNEATKKSELNELNFKISEIEINEQANDIHLHNDEFINNLKIAISELEQQCDKLENEVSNKQVELTSLEEVICIRDSLCKDLQEKLSAVETCLEETRQRLEMVKGHHALALDANESIRREYKAELEALKTKLEDEKQAIIGKCWQDQEATKAKYNDLVKNIKEEINQEKDEVIHDLQQKLIIKESEMKAKLDQIDEATNEKLRLCEIQFEERCRSIQEHWTIQEEKIRYLEKETKSLKYSLDKTEDKNNLLEKEINTLRTTNETLQFENNGLAKEVDELKDESKTRLIAFENQINKLTVEVDKALKDKNKYEMSLTVTRDIVDVLTMRLRASDDEVEHLEGQVQILTSAKEKLENELENYKSSINNVVMECNEYKEALVNILKSKAALAKEHTRIMEHNVSLIESLQNVEKEAFRELGSIKNELIEDVESLKKESSSQIQILRDEVEKKRALARLAAEQATSAAAAAGQSRALLARAAGEIERLEQDNQRLTQQIQDQQSLVVELSLLRQENEELTMTVAKQSSIIDKMKKDIELQSKPKSPSVIRKSHKLGKENTQLIISPLRERNH